MITLADAFLADILANPDDDAPRLIYADWLEEYGDPDQRARAEFIRVQCELAGRGICPYQAVPAHPWGRCFWCEKTAALRRRERGLLGWGWPTWAAEAFGTRKVSAAGDLDAIRVVLGGGAYLDCAFRRGFVASVRLGLAAWLEHGPALVRAYPLERVELSDREPVEVSSQVRSEPWTFPVADDPERRNAIPWALFEAMGSREWHPSRAAALDALSAACLAWAREPG